MGATLMDRVRALLRIRGALSIDQITACLAHPQRLEIVVACEALHTLQRVRRLGIGTRTDPFRFVLNEKRRSR
jgi:hypothetical protein